MTTITTTTEEPAAQPQPTGGPKRRVPPPCWADDEAQALISAYKEKWLALGRTNLKSPDWDDVAASVASVASTTKTAVQCRHKMEKLRKRYRSEKQRALTRPGKVFSSSWALFQSMDNLESETKGIELLKVGGKKSSLVTAVDEFVNDRQENNNNDGGARVSGGFPVKSLGHRTGNVFYNKFGGDEDWGTTSVVHYKDLGKEVVDPVEDIVSSIQSLGEKFVNIEKRKMEMAREMVMMQMDMEMKQNKVIMESQQRIVNVCVTALLESNKKKRRKKINVESPGS